MDNGNGLEPVSREKWGSRITFVLAAAGSAVGLGNIWGFPTITAQNGGGAFVLIYILCVLLVGLPVMLAEMVIGRAGENNPIGALRHLKPGTHWRFVGALGVITGFIILSFYVVISGWTLYYFFEAVRGTLVAPPDLADSSAFYVEKFDTMVRNPGLEILFAGIFMLATITIVAAGVKRGIARSIKVMMPLLLVLLIVLIGRAVTLPGAAEGLRFYLVPNFDAITPKVVVLALGQAFFSLSLGMGAMLTYGSYLAKDECLPSSAGLVVTTDTAVSILAGLIVFPVLFFMITVHGASMETIKEGPGLVFIVFPQIINELPGGPVMATLYSSGFFLLLAIAALTSAISLLEVVTAHLIDDWKIPRARAAWGMGIVIFLLSVPSALSQGAVDWLTDGIFEMSFFDLLYTLTYRFFLPAGALGLAIFVGWSWGLDNASREIRLGSPNFRLEKAWHVMIRYVAPIAIGAIFVTQVVELIRS